MKSTVESTLTAEPSPPAEATSHEPSHRAFYLDVVRGFAVLLVLGRHCPANIRIHPALDTISDILHQVGYLGVDLFFVLSGYLIGGLLFKELDRTGTIGLRRFFVRRAFKIWPAYLICLTASCLALAFFDKRFVANEQPLESVARLMWPAFLHIQNYFPSTRVLSFLWSLAVEEHFYLLLPAALLLMRRGSRSGNICYRVLLTFLALAMTCLLLRFAAREANPVFSSYANLFPTHLRIDSLMAGVALVATTRYCPNLTERLRPTRWPALLIGVALLLLPWFFPPLPPGKYPVIYPVEFSMFSGVLFVAAAHYADHPASSSAVAQRLRKLLAPVAAVGVVSYSTYLWHGYFAPPISARVMHFFHVPVSGSGLSTVVHYACYVVVALAMGIASYYVIERPFLALREHVAKRP
ncbi:MAG: hypothetical protein C0483_13615 [Pirellula sp.]|nr:hypothetical protein [Pirellula sp.]